MATRGFIGFRTTKEQETISNVYGIYNHYDSYYAGVGMDMLEIYLGKDKMYLEGKFKGIKWLNGEGEHGKCIIDYIGNDEGCIELNNDNEFMTDGLDCEYAYIINLESDTLEVYRGFFDEGQYEGQQYYKSMSGKCYYVNKVFEVSRESNLKKVKDIFEGNCDKKSFNDDKYWEAEYLNNKNVK